VLALGRNFLHSTELEFTHPITGKQIELKSRLPEELNAFLIRLKDQIPEDGATPDSGPNSRLYSREDAGH
jgi:hypothetical protein